ncbi:MAG TPA: ABC transporter ATP-binding protein [Gaiellaceae bacterium]|nr:ABC transporter ATP-binding protein [Gaiellaceae bacterium]
MADGVVIRGLVKTWTAKEGPVHAVRGIDVSIRRGETVALLGPNGAGKSTTIDMLLGLTRPDAGTITVLDQPPRDAVAQGLVGAMLQTGSLVRDVSVRELIAMVASLYPNPLDVDEALELTGLTSLAGHQTQKLSGGETQRARFALAIASNPELLVLDEPTVAMDVEARRSFWRTMHGYASRGKTILFATHYLDEADDAADRVVLMAHGQVVADGPPTEIKAKVGNRSLRATLPDVDIAELIALPGVAAGDRRGESVHLVCTDSDAAIRALLDRYPGARDIEIQGAGLEEAFVELTR